MKKLVALILCAMMLLTPAAAVAEGANIVWAGWSGEEEATKDIFQKMMDTYEAETGNTVTWVGWTWADTAQQLLIRVQGGEQLDIAQTDISIFNTVAQAGVLADWTEILGEDYLKENFEEAALASGRIDGKHFLFEYSHTPQEVQDKYLEACSNLSLSSGGLNPNPQQNGGSGLIL